MNKQRRKALNELTEKIRELMEELETLQDEEQECYDNMPEGIHDSEYGERASEAIDSLQEA